MVSDVLLYNYCKHSFRSFRLCITSSHMHWSSIKSYLRASYVPIPTDIYDEVMMNERVNGLNMNNEENP